MPFDVRYQDFNDASFDAFVEATMAEFNTLGMAILVVNKDGVRAKGYGYSDLSSKTPVTPHTLFQAASTTKSFTSAVAAHLVESPEHPAIKWDTPLAELIRDDFVLDQSTPEGQWATTHVTIEDALSHRSGLSRHDMIWTNGVVSNREIVRSLRHVPISTQLRTKWDYSNNMYTAVAHAIETTLDTPFGDLLKEQIFEPLNMGETSYILQDAQKLADANDHIDLAKSYLWDADLRSHKVVEWNDLPPPTAAGGIISNVLDYSHWVRHLMKPSELNNALSRNAVEAMRMPRIVLAPDTRRAYVGPQAYGLGLYSQVYRGREVVQHSGGIGGYMTEMVMLPPSEEEIKQGREDEGWAVIVMQNSFNTSAGIVVWHLIDEYLKTPADERVDSRKLARDVQAEREESMLPKKATKQLFGDEQPSTRIQPSLELQSYAGVYSHPAYHELQISVGDEKHESSSSMGAIKPGQTLHLRSHGQYSYIALTATLHHFSAEWWWAHRQFGPRSWITDSAVKVQFVVGPDGRVEGMRYQTELSLPDKLALFKKIE